MKKETYVLKMPSHSFLDVSAKIRQSYLEKMYAASENPEQNYLSRREAEYSLLNYISLGNVALVDEFIECMKGIPVPVPIGSMSVRPLHQARYSLVAGVTLFCREAIDNGLPESIAYQISDSFIQYADRTDDLDKINYLFFQALHEYCQAVQDWRLSSARKEIRLCCEYIMAHMHQKITIAELSDLSHLSPNYLSDLFQKELGMRPLVYIRKEKLHYAAFILQNSDASVSEIAELLAFPSASAFAKYFEAEYQILPNQYKAVHPQ